MCTCGLTVYDPPIPCGTVMQCTYPCRRPAPACGHPTTPHTCHEDTAAAVSSSCPPCPFLATKLCACGKKLVPNVRCSLETDKVSCGTVCGKYVFGDFSFFLFFFFFFLCFFFVSDHDSIYLFALG